MKDLNKFYIKNFLQLQLIYSGIGLFYRYFLFLNLSTIQFWIHSGHSPYPQDAVI
jgi:hypothetical protein